MYLGCITGIALGLHRWPSTGPAAYTWLPGGHPRAGLEQHPASSRFKICFRWGGQQFKRTVKTTNRSEAQAILLRLEENIGLVARGRLAIPPEADIATFLLADAGDARRCSRVFQVDTGRRLCNARPENGNLGQIGSYLSSSDCHFLTWRCKVLGGDECRRFPIASPKIRPSPDALFVL